MVAFPSFVRVAAFFAAVITFAAALSTFSTLVFAFARPLPTRVPAASSDAAPAEGYTQLDEAVCMQGAGGACGACGACRASAAGGAAAAAAATVATTTTHQSRRVPPTLGGARGTVAIAFAKLLGVWHVGV